MKKLITFLLCWATAAFGQTFPVNNLLVNGTTTLTGSTAHSVLFGQGSSAVTYGLPGTAGFALLSNGAGADPSFQALQSSSLNFIQAGAGAVNRILQSKVREVSVNVNDYGADPTGGTDSTTPIQSAINQVEALGGGYVDFSPGLYVISRTLGILNSGVKLRGSGHDNNHDNGNPATVTTLEWNGSSGGTMINISPPGTQRLSDNGITGIFLSSNNGLAGIGADLYSTNWGTYDIAGDMFSTVLFRLGPSLSLTAEAPDPQYNTISLDHRNLTNNGSTLILNGTNTANASFDYFPKIHAVVLKSTNALVLNNADNDVFETVSVFGSGTGSGNSLILGAGAVQNARANTFEHFSSNMPVYAQGTEIGATPSQNNQIMFWDVENNAINVSQGTNATIFVGSNHAPSGYRSYAPVVGGTSVYQEAGGRIIEEGFSSSIAVNSSQSITLPKAFNSGALNVLVTPNGGNTVRFSATCSTTTLTIFNGADNASSFFWRVEGL